MPKTRTVEELVREAERQGPAYVATLTAALARRLHTHTLGTILETWQLSNADAARIFGVSRQAVAKWLSGGVPPDRLETLYDLQTVTDLLLRRIRPERIPVVVRRKADLLDGRSLLELAQEVPSDVLRDKARHMFDLRRVVG